MQNGITRLYNAIWYQQLGRALEQKDVEKENIENTDASIADDINIQHDNSQRTKKLDKLSDNSEFLQDINVQNKSSRIVTQKVLIDNIDAVRQTYEDIINDKKDNIQRYKHAMGQFIAIVEQKKNSLKDVTEKLDKLEQMKKAVTAKAESISLELKLSGLSDREIEQHPDYTRCIDSYNDFNSTVMEKKSRITELEDDIKRAQADIERHKPNITQLHRDVEKIKTEQSEAIADLITAREKEEINAILSDINVD